MVKRKDYGHSGSFSVEARNCTLCDSDLGESDIEIEVRTVSGKYIGTFCSWECRDAKRRVS